MKYFMDFEFLEGKQDKTIFGIKYGETKPTIDLISIGIVAEDGREYYAISKEFNLREAWDRYDKVINKHYPLGPEYNKVYWIRDNILYSIYLELSDRELHEQYYYNNDDWNYKEFKRLINKYGKTNKQIVEEIKDFVSHKDTNLLINNLNFNSEIEWCFENRMNIIDKKYPHYLPKFYGYYSDYDWVVFCWLFGKMIDLPNGFPMFTIDLKQELDRKAIEMSNGSNPNLYPYKFEEALKVIKSVESYPKQTNEHNALNDARFNKELYEFLNKL